MALDWSGSIIVKVTEATVGYIVTGTDPDALGVATISGDAALSRISDAEALRQNFRLSLTIQGRSASQAKAAATVWPRLFDEVTVNDSVIGIVLKADEYDHRQGHVYLVASQFEKLVSKMNSLTSSTAVTLYFRESTLSERDLIVRVDLYTKMVAPQPDNAE
jgi:hypothetical protein